MSRSPERISSYRRHFEEGMSSSYQVRVSSPSPVRREGRAGSAAGYSGRAGAGVVRMESAGRTMSAARRSRMIGAGVGGGALVCVGPTGQPPMDLDAAAVENQEFKHTRTSERQEMVVLNDRLAVYIDKVRSLEQQNKLLEAEIEAYQNRFLKPSGLRLLYEEQLRELKKIADQMKAQRNIAFAAKDSTSAQLAAMKLKYEEAIELKRKAEAEIEAFRPDVDQATSSRIALEKRFEQLEVEIEFLKRVHHQEIDELMKQIYAAHVSAESAFSLPDLAGALKQIQNQYDDIAAKNLQEMDSWYKNKFEDMTKKTSRHVDHVRSFREGIGNAKKEIQNKERDLEALKTKNEALEAKIREMQEKYRKELEELQARIESLQIDMKTTKEKIALHLREYQDLLNIKMSLEIEITTYRKLIEGEDLRLAGMMQTLSLSSCSMSAIGSGMSFGEGGIGGVGGTGGGGGGAGMVGVSGVGATGGGGAGVFGVSGVGGTGGGGAGVFGVSGVGGTGAGGAGVVGVSGVGGTGEGGAGVVGVSGVGGTGGGAGVDGVSGGGYGDGTGIVGGSSSVARMGAAGSAIGVSGRGGAVVVGVSEGAMGVSRVGGVAGTSGFGGGVAELTATSAIAGGVGAGERGGPGDIGTGLGGLGSGREEADKEKAAMEAKLEGSGIGLGRTSLGGPGSNRLGGTNADIGATGALAEGGGIVPGGAYSGVGIGVAGIRTGGLRTGHEGIESVESEAIEASLEGRVTGSSGPHSGAGMGTAAIGFAGLEAGAVDSSLGTRPEVIGPGGSYTGVVGAGADLTHAGASAEDRTNVGLVGAGDTSVGRPGPSSESAIIGSGARTTRFGGSQQGALGVAGSGSGEGSRLVASTCISGIGGTQMGPGDAKACSEGSTEQAGQGTGGDSVLGCSDIAFKGFDDPKSLEMAVKGGSGSGVGFVSDQFGSNIEPYAEQAVEVTERRTVLIRTVKHANEVLEMDHQEQTYTISGAADSDHE